LKTLISLLALTISSTVIAQQDALLSIYWNNLSLINPGATGLFYKHQAAVNYRNRRNREYFFPNNLIAGYNAKIEKIHGGIGFNYQHETIRSYQVHRLDLNYGYHFDLGKNRTISAGISGGVMQFLDKSDFILPSSGDTISFDIKIYSFLSNFGVVYKGNILSVGISSTQLFSIKLNDANYVPSSRYLNLFASCDLNVAKKFAFRPQFIVRTDFYDISVDFNFLARYNNRFWAGIIYRYQNAVGFSTGLDIKEKYRVGYTYDIEVYRLPGTARTTHEIALGFLLK
jgi:type IX secretion system PorP/SprF family membrane protein